MEEKEFSEKASLIKERIDGAKRVLLCVHHRPDGDSVGGNLALKWLFEKWGKEVTVVAKEMMERDFVGLIGLEEVMIQDVKEMDLSQWEVLVICDSSSWYMVGGDPDWVPKIPEGMTVINIDHHQTGESLGEINLILPEINSSCEILAKLFSEWGSQIDEREAQALLYGVLTDSGIFQNEGTTTETLRTAASLMGKGAKLARMVFNLKRRNSLAMYKYWGRVLDKAEVDRDGRFIYAALTFEEKKVLEKYGDLGLAKEIAAGVFFQELEGTSFGVLMEEREPGVIAGSLRAREEGFDVSEVAVALGGGGHKAAAGFKRRFSGSFEDEVERVLEVCRRMGKERYEKSKAVN